MQSNIEKYKTTIGYRKEMNVDNFYKEYNTSTPIAETYEHYVSSLRKNPPFSPF